MILTLDLATKTGWCKGDGESRPLSGVIRLPSTGDDVGSFLAAYVREFRALTVDENVSSIVFEAPLLPQTTSFKTVTKLHSLAGMTEYLCLRHKIPCASAHNGKIKKAMTGKGNAKKPEMIAGVKALGFNPADDNEADAIAIWFYAMGAKSPLEQSALVRTWAG